MFGKHKSGTHDYVMAKGKEVGNIKPMKKSYKRYHKGKKK